MLNSFSAALSALKAHTTAIDVVGNNLANLNTTGFKASSVSFHDLLARSLGGGAETGFGVGPVKTVRQFTQGSVQPTGKPLDGAIQGEGFFVVRNPAGKQLYTRSGSFEFDQNGILQTTTGEQVQGWSLGDDGTVNTSTPIGKIVISESLLQPLASSKLSLGLNVSSTSPNGDTLSTPVELYDSLGNSFVATVTLTKVGANEWSYNATVPGAVVGSTNPAVQIMSSTSDPAGNLKFSSDGRLTSPAATAASPKLTITGLANGAADMSVDWNLFDANGNSTVTQFSSPSATSSISKNGRQPSQMTGVHIAEGGRIIAEFANREELQVGQLALASIRNPGAMTSVGNNNFEATVDTAVAAIGPVNSGGRGQIIGGALELSNVDLASELTNLIIYQRGYSANTKVITTSDEISQETINLKR